jgi:hypothetical protein
MVCRFYRAFCRKWGPRIDGRRVTFSGAAFVRAREGRPFWRDRIDGFFLLVFSQHQHCQASYQRGRAPTDAKKGPRK